MAAALEARRRYSVQLIDEPVAAAAGPAFDLAAGAGGFIVDIGGGTTEVAAVAGWRVVRAESLRMAAIQTARPRPRKRRTMRRLHHSAPKRFRQ